jgi:aerobic carbon-monoxide dehydrogenase large subunit
MTQRPFGQSIAPREDPALLRGQAKFTGDITPPGTVHMQLLLSEHAHALIKSVDVTRASGMPGVLRVLTGAELDGKVMPLPCIWIPGGVESHFPPHPYGVPGAGTVLAVDRVRYIGEAVAAVVAETAAQARDAAEAIVVDYEPLPVVVGAPEALEDSAVQLHDAVPGNLNARWTCGDEARTDAAIATADVVVELDLRNQRTINSPIEPRAALGEYDPATQQYTLNTTSQSPHNHRFLLSALVLGIPFDKLRVVSSHVGGSFGTKGYLYGDMALVLLLAAELGRPVKWVDTRNGLMRSTVQGRDQVQHVTLAGTSDGLITALRCTSYANLGAYPSTVGPGVATALMGRSITGPYAIPNAFCEVFAAFTNTVPLGAQRGSGRAEATHLMERLVDVFARKVGMDAAEIRRRNMVPAEKMPYDNGLGWLYDSGDYPAALELAMARSRYADVPQRRAEARQRGKLLGVGIGSYVAVCGVGPSARMAKEGMLGGGWESANIRVQPSGSVVVTVGSASTGQSHETTFAQIAADTLGIGVDSVTVRESDTEQAPYGQGTYGSRSYSVGGPAVHRAALQVLDQLRRLAAHLFGVDPSAVSCADGVFSAGGDPERCKTFAELAMAMWYGWDLPPGMEPAIDVTTFYDPPDFNFPFGSHVAVVEVDEATGEVDLVDYVAVNDAGTIGNPLVVDRQVEGSIVHALGQALMEEAVYDDDGRLLSDDLRSYAMPRAQDVPALRLDWTCSPSPHNPLGVKGAGEIATVPPTAAVCNAVCDALAEFGVVDVQMPITPERVWRAMQQATERSGTSAVTRRGEVVQ